MLVVLASVMAQWFGLRLVVVIVLGSYYRYRSVLVEILTVSQEIQPYMMEPWVCVSLSHVMIQLVLAVPSSRILIIFISLNLGQYPKFFSRRLSF